MYAESTITIDSLERLAADLELGEEQRRERLQRLVRAYARILAVREPGDFKRRHLEYSDEDGHWDSSYPPEQQYKDRNGPRLIRVAAAEWEEVATSEGFYHDWRAVTSDLGLYVARDGEIWGCTYDGTGHFGAYAAHPGSDQVQLTLDWAPREIDDVATADLMAVEECLRDLAFPLLAKKLEAARAAE